MVPLLHARAFHKILVSFDGSSNSIEACDVATILAKSYNSKILLAYAIPPLPLLSPPRRIDYEAKFENKTSLQALKMESHMTKMGIEAKTKILRTKGAIATSLIELSEEERVDLIVAGTRGLGDFKRMILGSVSTNFLNNAHCPVLIVRKRVYQIVGPQIRKILVATDGSKFASRAVEFASSIAMKLDADLTIAHVIYLAPVAYGGMYSPDLYKDLEKQGNEILATASETAKENGVYAITKQIDENQSPVWALTRFAEEGKFDLVVVGTRGLSGLRRAFLGSVANGVAHYAKCSVLVTK